MAPKLHFIGTGSPEIVGTRNAGGFLIKTAKGTLLVDPGPGAAQSLGAANIKVDGIIVTDKEKGHDADLIHTTGHAPHIDIEQKKGGVKFKLPDAVLTYISAVVDLKEIKEYFCDVLILGVHDQSEKLIQKLHPKLAILTCFNKSMHEKNPVYVARELQKETGVKTIAAQDNLIVDLYSYAALAEQKALSKFIEEK